MPTDAASDVPANARELEIRTRNMCADLSEVLNEILPAGRAKALALTKLDECSMWSTKAALS